VVLTELLDDRIKHTMLSKQLKGHVIEEPEIKTKGYQLMKVQEDLKSHIIA
jgi:hypothetical protein